MSTTQLDDCEKLEKQLEAAKAKRDQLMAERDQALREARRRWAEPVVDAWPSDLQAASLAIDAARAAFVHAVPIGWAEAYGAYRGWHEAVARVRTGHNRVNVALSYLGKIRFDDGSMADLPDAARNVPPFLDAISGVIPDLMTAVYAEVSATFAAERLAVDEGRAS